MVPDAPEKVARIVPGVLDDAARAAYATLQGPKYNTSGGLGSVDGALYGAALFEVVVDGATVARYALKQVQRPNGTEVFIVGAVGSVPGVDLLKSIWPAVALQCADADRVTINTRRKGLVKKLIGQGWTLDSYVLRKKMK